MSVVQAKWFPYVEHFIAFFIITFASQITIAGQSLDLTTATGRAAAVTAVLSVVWLTLQRFLGQAGRTM